jgi:hypothetical protein
MQFADIVGLFGAQSTVYLISIAFGLAVFSYARRSTAHALSISRFPGLYREFRIVSASVTISDIKLRARNHAVLMEHGRETVSWVFL